MESLHNYIGKEPSYAAQSMLDFAYLALPGAVIRVDRRAPDYFEWLAGRYQVLGVDYATDRLHADADSAMTVKRATMDDGLLESEITVPTRLNWIIFVGQSTFR